jgi:RNA polymerase sigma-70 factor (ECF subfamily)
VFTVQVLPVLRDDQEPIQSAALPVRAGWQLSIAGRLVFDGEALETFTAEWAHQSQGRAERVEALDECLGQLASHPKKVMRMRYFGDRTAEQIAEKLGSNGGSIRVTLQRIRTQLRECIERKMQPEGGTP